jgi:hypothetical protein
MSQGGKPHSKSNCSQNSLINWRVSASSGGSELSTFIVFASVFGERSGTVSGEYQKRQPHVVQLCGDFANVGRSQPIFFGAAFFFSSPAAYSLMMPSLLSSMSNCELGIHTPDRKRKALKSHEKPCKHAGMQQVVSMRNISTTGKILGHSGSTAGDERGEVRERYVNIGCPPGIRTPIC